MDRILKILKKENGPRASSAPALELNTIIFKHVYWYMQQISGERLQDHWSSGFQLLFEGCHHQTLVSNFGLHYENTPMQYTEIFLSYQKFSLEKKLIFFLNLLKT